MEYIEKLIRAAVKWIFLKEWFTKKENFAHYLLTLMWSQTCMNFYCRKHKQIWMQKHHKSFIRSSPRKVGLYDEQTAIFWKQVMKESFPGALGTDTYTCARENINKIEISRINNENN